MRRSCSGLIRFAILFIALPMLLAACVPQSIPGAALTEANDFYEEGQFIEAVAVYQALIAQGVDEPVVYYNLGNAYLRLDQLGYAIVNYRRAQQLAPRDQEIVDNLAFALA